MEEPEFREPEEEGPAPPPLRQFLELIRTCLPEDPWQLVFAVGVLLVFVSPRTPVLSANLLPGDSLRESLVALRFWISLIAVWAGLVLCAGARLAFYPSKSTRRLAVWGVTFAGLLIPTATAAMYLRLTPDVGGSLFLGGDSSGVQARWLLTNFWELPPVFHLSLAGTILLLLFAIRYALRETSLPLQLRPGALREDADAAEWSRLRNAVFFLAGPSQLAMLLTGALFLMMLRESLGTGIWNDGLNLLALFEIAAVCVVGVAVLLGESLRRPLRGLLRRFSLSSCLIAVAIAVPVASFYAMGSYVYDSIEWSKHQLGRFDRPSPMDYMGTHVLPVWVMAGLMFAVIGEEIVFRGWLLPALGRRYGWVRGIGFSGLLWATLHFFSDAYFGLRLDGILLHLAGRILLCVAMGAVLSWLVLRWGSLWPAVVAHFVYNILVVGGLVRMPPWPVLTIGAAWAIAAVILFHYWPLEEGMGSEPVGAPEAEAAI